MNQYQTAYNGADGRPPNPPANVEPRPLNALAKAVVLGMMMLVALGVVVAISNLPVITGCAFYGQCSLPKNPPTELGVSPVE